MSLSPCSSIVSAETFHFSVRNGKRWYHLAPITRKFLISSSNILKCLTLLSLLFAFPVLFEHGSKSAFRRVSVALLAPSKVKRNCVFTLLNPGKARCKQVCNLIGLIIYSKTISTGKLNTLRYLHRPPINLVVYKGFPRAPHEQVQSL